TILFSTHRMDQVEKLCESICLINHGKAVLQGNLKQVKAQYGKNTVQIQYEGNGNFLKGNPLVQSFSDYGNHVDVQLAKGADPQNRGGGERKHRRVRNLGVRKPPLEQIFIDVVGKTDA